MSLRRFLEFVLPPEPHPVLAYRTAYRKPDGKYYFGCEAFRSVTETVEAAQRYSSGLGILDLYVCVGRQLEARFAQRTQIP